MSLNQSFISDFSEYSRWSQRTKNKINCTMVDVRGDVLRPPHCISPAEVKANKKKMNSFKSNENIHKKEDGSYCEVLLIKSHQWPCNDPATKARAKSLQISDVAATGRHYKQQRCWLDCPDAHTDGINRFCHDLTRMFSTLSLKCHVRCNFLLVIIFVVDLHVYVSVVYLPSAETS